MSRAEERPRWKEMAVSEGAQVELGILVHKCSLATFKAEIGRFLYTHQFETHLDNTVRPLIQKNKGVQGGGVVYAFNLNT